MSEALNMHDDEAEHNTTGDGLGILTAAQIVAYQRTRDTIAAELGALAGVKGDRTERHVRELVAAHLNVSRKLDAHDREVRVVRAGGILDRSEGAPMPPPHRVQHWCACGRTIIDPVVMVRCGMCQDEREGRRS